MVKMTPVSDSFESLTGDFLLGCGEDHRAERLALLCVAVWILHLPVPGVSGAILIVIFRRPAKDVLCLFNGGQCSGGTSPGRRADRCGNDLPARCLFKCGHQLQHGRSLARPQIENVILAVRFFKIVQRGDVSLRQIDHMDVVADPRSVHGIVLIAVNAQIRELPEQGCG